ncbi:pancreatic triacylglycerol lipase-like [Schistocerca americana]|uniref:pancreatic triacylglycerol lipase-like n=1 Tax=Schistocerca americana TaxID=7009 RepID=UPI001F4F5863|nr:pancreatic triacylglycerol lipase-like [Schistocerca americana]
MESEEERQTKQTKLMGSRRKSNEASVTQNGTELVDNLEPEAEILPSLGSPLRYLTAGGRLAASEPGGRRHERRLLLRLVWLAAWWERRGGGAGALSRWLAVCSLQMARAGSPWEHDAQLWRSAPAAGMSPLLRALAATVAFAALAAQLAAAGPVTTTSITEFVGSEFIELSEDDDVQFHLYTRSHPRGYLRLEAVEQTDYDPRRRTVLMAHGYLGSGTTETVMMMRDAVLEAADVHFVAVHWGRLADGDYRDAASNTTVVAERVAALLDALIAGLGARDADFHLLGFSLGAQVMGQVGHAMTAGRVHRITALDPAKPLFDSRPLQQRLDSADAELVVVLHTAGGIAAFAEPLGHLDFYPNGGVSPQPACVRENFPLVCSHMMAPSYLAEAVRRPGAFVGSRCTSWDDFSSGRCEGQDGIALGLFQNYSTFGSFYLRTAEQSPYGLGEAGARPSQPMLDPDNSLEAEGAAQRREGRMRDLENTLPPAGGSGAVAPWEALLLLLAATSVAMATT